jgi:hypothetical protein
MSISNPSDYKNKICRSCKHKFKAHKGIIPLMNKNDVYVYCFQCYINELSKEIDNHNIVLYDINFNKHRSLFTIEDSYNILKHRYGSSISLDEFKAKVNAVVVASAI